MGQQRSTGPAVATRALDRASNKPDCQARSSQGSIQACTNDEVIMKQHRVNNRTESEITNTASWPNVILNQRDHATLKYSYKRARIRSRHC